MDRYRWLTSLLIAIVATLGALGLARGAVALTPPDAETAAADPFELDEAEAGEDEGEGADDSELGNEEDEGEGPDQCEFADEAAEEACEEAVEEREAEEAETEECRLESAEATVAAVPGSNQLRLTVRYKTLEPSTVAVELALRGGKGALDLGTDTARFGRAGTLHSDRTLSDAQMARALAAREFTVGLHALNTPGFCSDSFERHLTARQGTGAGLRWSDPSAERRAKAAHAAHVA